MCESIDDDLEEISSNWSHMMGSQLPSIQSFGASNFGIWCKTWGIDLEKSHLKVSENGMRIHMMTHVKCAPQHPTIYCWLNKEIPNQILIYT
jgi:hypothetical protein